LAPVELLSFQRWQLLETCHARWRWGVLDSFGLNQLPDDRKEASKEAKKSLLSSWVEGAVTGKEGFESGSENLAMSPNLLD
jgi:hypothetical protein